MTPIDTVLQRLDSPKPTGRERWRAACPVCGERNRSTLSIGVGDSGAVLLKCFKLGCGPDAIAGALGLELADLFPDRREPGHGAGPLKRRRMLSAGQALDLLVSECTLVWVAAVNLANGHALKSADLERLSAAAARIGELAKEARS